MAEVSHEGVVVRTPGSMPQWVAPLAVRYFRQTAADSSDNEFAVVVKVDSLFPPDWTRAQRRERFKRMATLGVEIDGRFVMSTYLRPKRTKSLYENTRMIRVAPGRLPGAGSHSAATIHAPLHAPRDDGAVDPQWGSLPMTLVDPRLDALERRVAALEAALAMDVPGALTPAATPALALAAAPTTTTSKPVDLARLPPKFMSRLEEHEENLARLLRRLGLAAPAPAAQLEARCVRLAAGIRSAAAHLEGVQLTDVDSQECETHEKHLSSRLYYAGLNLHRCCRAVADFDWFAHPLLAD